MGRSSFGLQNRAADLVERVRRFTVFFTDETIVVLGQYNCGVPTYVEEIWKLGDFFVKIQIFPSRIGHFS